MGWASIFSAIAQGITNTISTIMYVKENKNQAKEVAYQAQQQADERARQAKKLMAQQKTSFLKGGVYFNDGSAKDVIDETYDTAMRDIQAINRDSITNQKKLIRSSKTAFLTYLIDPVGNNGANYANGIYQGFANSNKSSTRKNTKNSIKVSGGISGDNMTFA